MFHMMPSFCNLHIADHESSCVTDLCYLLVFYLFFHLFFPPYLPSDASEPPPHVFLLSCSCFVLFFLTNLLSCPLSLPCHIEPASKECEGDPGEPDGSHAGLLQEELCQPLRC